MSEAVKRPYAQVMRVAEASPWYTHRIVKGRYGHMTWEEKFWLFVDKQGPDDCWLWTGKKHKNGYGAFSVSERKFKLPHRVAYELEHGGIPDGLNVCHNCPTGDNRLCCNPAHLFTGTQADNIADMDNKGRRISLCGENSPVSKLTSNEILEIRRLFNVVGLTAPEIAKRFNTSATNVHSIARFSSWKHIGGPALRPEVAANRTTPKLTPNSVSEIKANLRSGQTHQSIADQYGVSRECITKIANGKNWKGVP